MNQFIASQEWHCRDVHSRLYERVFVVASHPFVVHFLFAPAAFSLSVASCLMTAFGSGKLVSVSLSGLHQRMLVPIPPALPDLDCNPYPYGTMLRTILQKLRPLP